MARWPLAQPGGGESAPKGLRSPLYGDKQEGRAGWVGLSPGGLLG